MMDPELSGLVIKDLRVEGITLKEALRETKNFQRQGLSRLFRWFEGPKLPPTVNLHFQDFPFISVSPDKSRVLAVGQDKDRQCLIRDDQLLLNDYSGIFVSDYTEDLSKLAVISTDLKGKKALHFIDERGEVKTLFEGMDEIEIIRSMIGAGRFIIRTFESRFRHSLHFVNAEGLRNTIFEDMDEVGVIYPPLRVPEVGVQLVAARGGQTTHLAVCDEDGRKFEDRAFTIDRAHELPTIRLERADHDFTRLVWSARFENKNCFYCNERLMAACGLDQSFDISTNPGCSRVWLSSREAPAQIILNGETIFEDQSQITLYHVNTQLTFAAAVLAEIGRPYKLFYMTPKGNGVREPFDQIDDIRAFDDHIYAYAKRVGVRRKLIIK